MGIEKDFSNFYKYEKIRRSGAYNMITEATQASKAANLTIKEYTDIIKRYSIISSKIINVYESIDNFMKEFNN